MGVNSLPKTVTRHRRGYDFNPVPIAPKSSTLPALGYRSTHITLDNMQYAVYCVFYYQQWEMA